MIPYLLAIAGGYLIAQSRKQDTFADGGDVSYDQNLVFDSTKGQLVPLNSIVVFDEKMVGKESIINIQKKYIKERDELIKNNVSSQELTEFVKSKVSVEYLIENGILSPVFRFYSYAFINTPSLGRPYGLKKAMEIAEKINTIKRYPDDKVSKYQVLIVPSPIVNIVSNIPDSDTYLIYTYGEGDIGISNEDLKKIGTGTFEDGGLLKYCWGGKMADGGMMAKGGEIYKIQQKFKYDLQPKWEDEKFQTGGHYYLSFKEAQDVKKKLQGLSSSMEYKVVKVNKMADGGMTDLEKYHIENGPYITEMELDEFLEKSFDGYKKEDFYDVVEKLGYEYDEDSDQYLKMAKGGKVENELYVAEFRKGEWTVKDKKNPKGNYTLSSKKENAENVRQFLIDNPSRLKYYRTNEYAKGGKVGTYVMTDDTYVNIFLSRGFYEKRGSMGLRYFEHLPTKVFITYDPKGFQTPVIISTDKTGEEKIYECNSIREVKEALDKLGIVTKKEGVYPTKFK